MSAAAVVPVAKRRTGGDAHGLAQQKIVRRDVERRKASVRCRRRDMISLPAPVPLCGSLRVVNGSTRSSALHGYHAAQHCCAAGAAGRRCYRRHPWCGAAAFPTRRARPPPGARLAAAAQRGPQCRRRRETAPAHRRQHDAVTRQQKRRHAACGDGEANRAACCESLRQQLVGQNTSQPCMTAI